MQATVEKAIQAVTGTDTRTTGSGRTDAGAHALGQIIAFSTASLLPADVLCSALNAHLPDDIAVTHAEETRADFHPRFDALSRTYRYLIWNHPERSPFYVGRAAHVKIPLDEKRMNVALNYLVGQTDVSAFVPTRLGGTKARQIYEASCRREGELVIVELRASGFLRQMVRAIVGTIIRVGRGALDLDTFQSIIASGRRELAGDTAPAHGLYLVCVDYPADNCDENKSSPAERADSALAGDHE